MGQFLGRIKVRLGRFRAKLDPKLFTILAQVRFRPNSFQNGKLTCFRQLPKHGAPTFDSVQQAQLAHCCVRRLRMLPQRNHEGN